MEVWLPDGSPLSAAVRLRSVPQVSAACHGTPEHGASLSDAAPHPSTSPGFLSDTCWQGRSQPDLQMPVFMACELRISAAPPIFMCVSPSGDCQRPSHFNLIDFGLTALTVVRHVTLPEASVLNPAAGRSDVLLPAPESKTAVLLQQLARHTPAGFAGGHVRFSSSSRWASP